MQVPARRLRSDPKSKYGLAPVEYLLLATFNGETSSRLAPRMKDSYTPEWLAYMTRLQAKFDAHMAYQRSRPLAPCAHPGDCDEIGGRCDWRDCPHYRRRLGTHLVAWCPMIGGGWAWSCTDCDETGTAPAELAAGAAARQGKP